MDWLVTGATYTNPDLLPFEIVERKGLGHPDTLADGLADTLSIAYSRHCLDHFGVIPHHNFDKLYIGGGSFSRGFGRSEMVKPVRVVINGRMSDPVMGRPIDRAEVLDAPARQYLGRILPHLDAVRHVEIVGNPTQHTHRPFWFSPRQIEDIPDAARAWANDTSVVFAHHPFSTCERLAMDLERELWEETPSGPQARYEWLGQDIKVMVVRREQSVDVTICLPTISSQTDSMESYLHRVGQAQSMLQDRADKIVEGTGLDVRVSINPGETGFNLYMLAIGSSIEMGEEGLVGRGNSARGIIAMYRASSVEAPFGKNPVYHVGRVYAFLAQNLAKAIYSEFQTGCSIVAMTKSTQSLRPPHTLRIETERPIAGTDLLPVIEREMLQIDYVNSLLEMPLVWRRW